MLVSSGVFDITETELEGDLFFGVTVPVETDRVEPLWMKGIWRRNTRVRIGGHRHDRGTRLALEEIEIAAIKSWIFLGQSGVKMVGQAVAPVHVTATPSRV